MFRTAQGIATSPGDVLGELEALKARMRALSQGNRVMRANARGFVVFGRQDCPHTMATLAHIQGLGFTAELVHTPPFQMGREASSWVQIMQMVPNASKTVPHVFEQDPSGAYKYIGNGQVARMAIRKAQYEAGEDFAPGASWNDVA